MTAPIRIATADDAAALTRLIWYVAGEAYSSLGTDVQMTVWLEGHSTSELEHLIRAESGGCVLLAEGRRRPIAMIGIDYADATWPTQWSDWGDCRLESFYVAVDGDRVAEALLHEALQVCQEDGRERVFIEIPSACPLVRMLEDHGFQVTDRHPGVVFPEAEFVTLARPLRPPPLSRVPSIS